MWLAGASHILLLEIGKRLPSYFFEILSLSSPIWATTENMISSDHVVYYKLRFANCCTRSLFFVNVANFSRFENCLSVQVIFVAKIVGFAKFHSDVSCKLSKQRILLSIRLRHTKNVARRWLKCRYLIGIVIFTSLWVFIFTASWSLSTSWRRRCSSLASSIPTCPEDSTGTQGFMLSQ